MFCKGCGQKLPEEAVKCPKCDRVTKPLNANVASISNAQKPPVKKAAAPAAKPLAAKKATPAPQPARSNKAAAPPKEQAPEGPPPELVFNPIEHDSGMLYGKAFTSFLKDSDWLKKALLLSATMFIPVLNFYTVGYLIQHARKVSNGIDIPLPEIDFPNIFKSGVMFAVSFSVLSMIGMAISMILGVFSRLSMISVLAIPLLAIFSLVFTVYFVGSTTVAVIEGNPWIVFNFPVCTQIIMTNLSDAIIVSLVLTVVGTILCTPIITGGLFCLISGNMLGQLGRIFRTNSKFM